MIAPTAITESFKGLNNRIDPTALGLIWQIQTDNALCDRASHLVKRPGNRLIGRGFKDLYASKANVLYAITIMDELVTISENGGKSLIAEELVGAPFYWAELGYAIFAVSESAAWAIYPQGAFPLAIPDCPAPEVSGSGEFTFQVACVFTDVLGRVGGTYRVVEIGGSEQGEFLVTPPHRDGYWTRIYTTTANGTELRLASIRSDGNAFYPDITTLGSRIETLHCWPMPSGNLVGLGIKHDRLVSGLYEPEYDRSVLYYSLAGTPHLFMPDEDFRLIPGKIKALNSVDRGVFIGTDRAMYLDSADTPLRVLAHYGVVGDGVMDTEGTLYFWSERGLCSLAPDGSFRNMTDDHLIPTNRIQSELGLLHWQGSRYAVSAMSGTPMAPLQQSYIPPALSS